jgi:hypothetical protein
LKREANQYSLPAMERFAYLLRWCIDHWKSWSIPTKFASTFGAVTSALVVWGKWKAGRQAKADKKIDARIILALQDHDLWSRPRVLTGGGNVGVRSTEIAEALSLDSEVVIDSLERLEARGRVRSASGTMDNPAPYWFFLHR